MKNSSQRKISFLVAFFGLVLLMPARAQVNEKRGWARDSGDPDFRMEMLKNKTGYFRGVGGFYPPVGDFGLLRLFRDPNSEWHQKQKGEQEPQENRLFPVYTGQDPVFSTRTLFFLSRPVIPENIYYCQSGFFCKKEWELEKATHIPFRFRLGSLDYCNVLEGKQRPAPF